MPHAALPDPGALFELAADRIRRVVAEELPGEPVALGGQEVFAKDSLLGHSLVSMWCGVAGDGDQVRAAQAVYAASPTSLPARETARLRAVGRCAGHRNGVLFSEAVADPSPLGLITKDPGLVGRRPGDADGGWPAGAGRAETAREDPVPGGGLRRTVLSRPGRSGPVRAGGRRFPGPVPGRNAALGWLGLGTGMRSREYMRRRRSPPSRPTSPSR